MQAEPAVSNKIGQGGLKENQILIEQKKAADHRNTKKRHGSTSRLVSLP